MFFTNVSIFAETCRYFFQKKQVLQDSKADLVIFRMNNVQTRLDVVGFGERKMYKSKGYNSMGQDRDDIVIAPYTTVMKRILAIDTYKAFLLRQLPKNKPKTQSKKSKIILVRILSIHPYAVLVESN